MLGYLIQLISLTARSLVGFAYSKHSVTCKSCDKCREVTFNRRDCRYFDVYVMRLTVYV